MTEGSLSEYVGRALSVTTLMYEMIETPEDELDEEAFRDSIFAVLGNDPEDLTEVVLALASILLAANTVLDPSDPMRAVRALGMSLHKLDDEGGE